MDQKTHFYSLLDAHITEENAEKFYITQAQYEKIVKALQLPSGAKCQDGASFKFWAKKHFKLQTVGTSLLLLCNKTSCPVATYETIFETLRGCHERVAHSGRRKTWDEVRSSYSWIKHSLIPIFISTCQACQTRQPAKHPPAGKLLL